MIWSQFHKKDYQRGQEDFHIKLLWSQDYLENNLIEDIKRCKKMNGIISNRDLNLFIRISREKRFRDVYEGKEGINKIQIQT